MDNSPIYSDLPNFLQLTHPLELDDLPLQVALLTMELARMRSTLALLAEALRAAGMAAALVDPDPFTNHEGSQ